MPRNKLSKFEQEARNTIASNLKKYMHGMTQADLAAKANIPVTTLSGYLRAKSTPNAGNLEKLANVLYVKKSDIDPRYSFNDIMDFMKNAPTGTYQSSNYISNRIDIDQSKIKYIPLIGTIAMGTPITAEQNIERYIPEFFLDDIPQDELFALHCKGHSMEPTIPDGAIAIIHMQPDVEDDEIAAVLVDDNSEATLKRIKHLGSSVLLQPDNRDYDPILLDKNHPGRILGKLIKYEVLTDKK